MPGVESTTLLAGLVKVVLATIDLCHTTNVFTYQLAFYASHLQTNVLSMLKERQGSRSYLSRSPELNQLLQVYTESMDSLYNMVVSIQAKPLLATLMSKNAEIDHYLKELTLMETKLTLFLQAHTKLDHDEMLELLKQAKEADDDVARRVQSLDKNFSEFVEGEKKMRGERFKDGELLTFFRNVADELSRQGTSSPWIQTASNFRSLLAELQSHCVRYKVIHLRESTQSERRVGSIEYIELIKRQTLHLLDELRIELPRLPSNFREEASDSLRHLDEVRSRVDELCLTVSFIGPAKSGKSTSINAILGIELFPSDTFPCTVMPTTIRHRSGQRLPQLCLVNKERTLFAAALKEVRTKADEIRALWLPDPEIDCLNDVVGGRVSLRSMYKGEEEVKEVLRFMNQFCRLFARALGEEKVSGENPLTGLIREKTWPRIEIEMEFLRNLQMVGNFEIVDSPGRDETSLIPEIGPAVTAAMQSSAAVVCVLNIQTAMTDSVHLVKRELSSALAFKQPVFILANRIDGLAYRQNVTAMEESIGKSFLRQDYSETTRQVFGVSALAALNVSRIARVVNTPDRVMAVRALPDLVDEVEEGTGFAIRRANRALDQTTLEAILATLLRLNGEYGWIDAAREYTEERRDRDLTRIGTNSRFDPFRDKLMKELAPRAGQKVLHDQIQHVSGALKSLAGDMDLFVNGMLAGEEEHKYRQSKLTAQIEGLRDIMRDKIPEMVTEHTQEMKRLVGKREKELHEEVACSVNQAFDFMLKNRLPDFKVEAPPTKENLNRYEHLKRVEGQQFFRAFAPESSMLVDQIRDAVQRYVLPTLEDCIHKNLSILKEVSAALRSSLLDKLSGSIGGVALDGALSSISHSLPTPTPPTITAIGEGMGTTERERIKVRRWYTLWTMRRWKKTRDSIFVVPFEGARALYLERSRSIVHESIEDCIDQCTTHLNSMADQVINRFNDRIEQISARVEEVRLARSQIQKKRRDVVNVARSRIILECILTELQMLMKQSEAEVGSDIENLFIQIELDEEEGAV